MKRHMLGRVAFAALVLASAAAAGNSPDAVHATWRGGSVTCGEFEHWLEDKKAAIDGPQARHLLDQYAVTELLATAARERGLGTGPLDEAIRRQREDVLYAALFQKSVVSAVSVGEDELDALVAQHPDAFSRPRGVRLFNLFKRLPARATADERLQLRQEIEALKTRVEDGGSFSELASAYSDSETGLRGGLIGVARPGDLPTAIEAEVMTLGAGAVSRIFESVEGFQIFFVERVIPAKRPTAEELRSNLRRNLRKQRIDEAWGEIKESLVERAGVRVFPEKRETPGVVLVSGESLEMTTLDLEADLVEVPVRGSFGEAAARVRLEFLAETRLLAAEARRRGISPSNTDLRSFDDRWRERLALLELARRVQSLVVRPTQEEVASYFNENASKFELPREFELWAIRVSFGPDDQLAQREAVESLSQAAAELTDDPSRFSLLAARLSDLEGLSPSGYLGWVGQRRLFSLSPNLRKAVEGQSAGELSNPIREGDSYWLVRLSDLREPRVPTLSEVFDAAEDRLGQIRTDEVRGQVELALLESLAVEIRGTCGSEKGAG